MSQRFVHHGELEALTGWDRPLQMFFLVIDRNGNLTFSNLNKSNNPNGTGPIGAGMTLESIQAAMAKYGIPVPPTLVADLEQDRLDNAGNLIHHYDSSSSTSSPHNPSIG